MMLNFSHHAKSFAVDPTPPVPSPAMRHKREYVEKVYQIGATRFAAHIGFLNAPEVPLSLESRQEDLAGIAEAFVMLAMNLGFKAQVTFEPVEGKTD
jgi:hypothetical protein